MSDRIELRVTGFGGQGVVLSAYIIGRACIESGKHATMIQSFGPEARGASCSATLVISPHEVLYPYIQRPEILIAMSGDGYATYRNELRPDGTLIYESDLVHPDGDVAQTLLSAPRGSSPKAQTRVSALHGIPSTRIAESLNKPMVQNIVMLGFVAAATTIVSRDVMRDAVKGSVPAGTEEINLRAFDEGARYYDEVIAAAAEVLA